MSSYQEKHCFRLLSTQSTSISTVRWSSRKRYTTYGNFTCIILGSQQPRIPRLFRPKPSDTYLSWIPSYSQTNSILAESNIKYRPMAQIQHSCKTASVSTPPLTNCRHHRPISKLSSSTLSATWTSFWAQTLKIYHSSHIVPRSSSASLSKHLYLP